MCLVCVYLQAAYLLTPPVNTTQLLLSSPSHIHKLKPIRHLLIYLYTYNLRDTVNDISVLSGRRKWIELSESLLLAPFSDEVNKKEGKLIKEALYQFISDTKVKI